MLKALATIIERLKVRLFYNPYTIAKYFRKKGAIVGEGNRILTRNLSSEPYLIRIGNNCTISYEVSFLTHDGGCGLFRKEVPELNVFGTIDIKDNCFIGHRAILMPNIIIGPNSIVGAGAVVTRDVPPGVIVAGNPARVIKSIDDYRVQCIKKYEALDLKGARPSWQPQLEEYFWKV